jgi:hypothetical protein
MAGFLSDESHDIEGREIANGTARIQWALAAQRSTAYFLPIEILHMTSREGGPALSTFQSCIKHE